ncbi:M28 family peptidase [Leptospira wolffii]|uniref:M28 family peptidase n=1 Tax=Leptospira wolffii TaxID=409998 RepID=A0ABV5BU62_9LEPT
MIRKSFYSFCILFLTIGFDSYSSPQIAPDAAKIKEYAADISSIRPFRNYRNISSLNKAADFIHQTFLNFGYSPKRQYFQVDGSKYQNLEVRIGPVGSKKIVIGAHYDVAGDQEGADDNASGVSALLEIARIVKIREKNLTYEIILVAYSLEEPPFFRTDEMGSYVHAKSLKDKNENIELMISLETIGYFSEADGSQEYPIFPMKWIYPNRGNFIAAVGRTKESKYLKILKNVFQNETDLPCETLIAPESLEGVDFSDHLNYWKFGYKALMITDTAFLRNKNYHQKSDTMSTLNFNKIAETVRAILSLLLSDKI